MFSRTKDDREYAVLHVHTDAVYFKTGQWATVPALIGSGVS